MPPNDSRYPREDVETRPLFHVLAAVSYAQTASRAGNASRHLPIFASGFPFATLSSMTRTRE